MSDKDYHELSEERMPAFGAKMNKSESGKLGATARLRSTTKAQRKATAKLGGLARAAKTTHAERVAMGKLGGRPRKEK